MAKGKKHKKKKTKKAQPELTGFEKFFTEHKKLVGFLACVVGVLIGLASIALVIMLLIRGAMN